MATKKTNKKSKPMPPCRIFFGEQLYHECNYEGDGQATTTYHDSSLDEKVEAKLTERLSEAAKSILAENPNTGLLNI